MSFHLRRTIPTRVLLIIRTQFSFPSPFVPRVKALLAPADRQGPRVLFGIARRFSFKRHPHVHVAASASSAMPTDHSSQANYEDIRTKHIDFGKNEFGERISAFP